MTPPTLRMHVLGPREVPGSQAHLIVTQAFSQFPVAGHPLPGLLPLWLAIADWPGVSVDTPTKRPLSLLVTAANAKRLCGQQSSSGHGPSRRALPCFQHRRCWAVGPGTLGVQEELLSRKPTATLSLRDVVAQNKVLRSSDAVGRL